MGCVGGVGCGFAWDRTTDLTVGRSKFVEDIDLPPPHLTD